MSEFALVLSIVAFLVALLTAWRVASMTHEINAVYDAVRERNERKAKP